MATTRTGKTITWKLMARDRRRMMQADYLVRLYRKGELGERGLKKAAKLIRRHRRIFGEPRPRTPESEADRVNRAESLAKVRAVWAGLATSMKAFGIDVPSIPSWRDFSKPRKRAAKKASK